MCSVQSGRQTHPIGAAHKNAAVGETESRKMKLEKKEKDEDVRWGLYFATEPGFLKASTGAGGLGKHPKVVPHK